MRSRARGEAPACRMVHARARARARAREVTLHLTLCFWFYSHKAFLGANIFFCRRFEWREVSISVWQYFSCCSLLPPPTFRPPPLKYWISVYFSLLWSCLRAHPHRLYILATTCRIPLAWALHPWGITPLHTKCLNRASIGRSTLAPSRACILSANSAPRSCISSCNTDRDFILLVILLLV